MTVASAGGWPIFKRCTIPGEGCPILAFFARACPELVEGVGGDAAGATLVRSTPPLVDAVVVPPFAEYAKGGAPAAVVRRDFALVSGHPRLCRILGRQMHVNENGQMIPDDGSEILLGTNAFPPPSYGASESPAQEATRVRRGCMVWSIRSREDGLP